MILINVTNLYKIVGGRITHHRKLKGYTQNTFADILGLGRSTISQIESGKQKASIFLLYRISELLDITIGELLPTILNVKVCSVTSNSGHSITVGAKTFLAIQSARQILLRD